MSSIFFIMMTILTNGPTHVCSPLNTWQSKHLENSPGNWVCQVRALWLAGSSGAADSGGNHKFPITGDPAFFDTRAQDVEKICATRKASSWEHLSVLLHFFQNSLWCLASLGFLSLNLIRWITLSKWQPSQPPVFSSVKWGSFQLPAPSPTRKTISEKHFDLHRERWYTATQNYIWFCATYKFNLSVPAWLHKQSKCFPVCKWRV